ncbi:hypothetical protein EOS_35635 [Caballeronia mineralivorans PML1(12)]|uniref:Uncharacterized protein n=1 Tax=Caballeronia mineralivorans PML1(12) TaxID=908627 RepID=A0A0J1CLW1_9BURK|nr:hypothetical protein [Caballeronia mineralivorans]KLU21504.1 hypothetical protein EOS_35635 [Caballeronia mineralivorans PML1(12)]
MAGILFATAAQLTTALQNEQASKLAQGGSFNYKGLSVRISAIRNSRTEEPSRYSNIGIHAEMGTLTKFLELLLQTFLKRTPRSEEKLTEFRSTIHEWSKGGVLENVDNLCEALQHVSDENPMPDKTRTTCEQKVSQLKGSLALYLATYSLDQPTESRHASTRTEVFRALSTLAGGVPTSTRDQLGKLSFAAQMLISYCDNKDPSPMESIDALSVAATAHLLAISNAVDRPSKMLEENKHDKNRSFEGCMGEMESIFNRLEQVAARIDACATMLKEDGEDTGSNELETENPSARERADELQRQFAGQNEKAKFDMMGVCLLEMQNAAKEVDEAIVVFAKLHKTSTYLDRFKESCSARVERASQFFDLCAATLDNSEELEASQQEKTRMYTSYIKKIIAVTPHIIPSEKDTAPN